MSGKRLKTADFPDGFRRRGGFVLGSRAKARRVSDSERRRVKMYRLIADKLANEEGMQRAQAEAESDEVAHRRRRSHDRRAGEQLRTALDDVIEGRTPNVEEMADHDALMVDSPLDQTARPRKQAVIVSLRNDPVGRMAKRRQISAVQLRAARKWQDLREHSEVGGAKAIDYTREHVDGGRIYDAFDTGRLQAAKVITKIDRRLGYEGAVLARRVLAEKLELAEVAKATGADKRADVEYLGRRFREALDTIARFFGYGEAARGKGPGVDDKGHGRILHGGDRPSVVMHPFNWQPDAPVVSDGAR